MFSPTSKKTLLVLTAMLLAVFTAESAPAQTTASAQFQARMAAMRQAQARAQASQTVHAAPAPAVRVAHAAPAPVVRVAHAAPVQTAPAVRVAQAPTARAARKAAAQSVSALVASGAKPKTSAVPAKQVRTAQLISEGTIIDGGSPILGETVLTNPIVSQPIISQPTEIIGSPIVSHPIVQPPIHGGFDTGVVYGEEIISEGCGCDACSGVGDPGGYFVDDCCGRGGCPGGCNAVPFWWQGTLGRALRSGSYFFGATAFRHPAFQSPISDDPNDLVQDSNFGAYGGFNLGLPLCRLTGGIVSGQFGIRSVQTNFNGNDFTSNNRDQLFVTAGVYRRVDYGLQAGLVVDFLAEEFFAESDVAQLRGELSWAFPNGGGIGFRFTSSQESDESVGTFNGTDFSGLTTSTIDHYRFFLRKIPAGGGWEEIFLGWTENEQFAIGADFDLPLAPYVSLEAGAVLYLSDAEAPLSNLGPTRVDDSFNLYVGFAFRPQGTRAYYRSYDRPLLPVADNGTLLLSRQ